MNKIVKTCIIGAGFVAAMNFGFEMGKGFTLGKLSKCDDEVADDFIEWFSNRQDLRSKFILFTAKVARDYDTNKKRTDKNNDNQ
jgi:hypothetical protein